MTGPRCAIYWAPPAASRLWTFGSAWLGRDAEADEALAPLREWGDPAAHAAATADPRLYGLHATLKPPFRLAAGRTLDDLTAALGRFAAATPPAGGPPLVLRRLGRFLALVPDGPAPAVQDLAARVVETFDGFRAPAPPEELAKRRRHGLSPVQEANLTRWGYPYVMDEFRFHVTLSGAHDPATLDRLEALLGPRVAQFGASALAIAELALFEQAGADAPFRLTRRVALTG